MKDTPGKSSPSRFAKLLDYLPLTILIIQSILLLLKVSTSSVGLQNRHIVGLISLFLTILAFWRYHKAGVVGLGCTLLMGLFGLLSFSPAIAISALWIGKTETAKIPIFIGQPVFIGWIALHLLLSWRHYYGFFTADYWKELSKGLQRPRTKSL